MKYHIAYLSGLGIHPSVFYSIIKNIPGGAQLLEYPDLSCADTDDILGYAVQELAGCILHGSIICGWSLGGLLAMKIAEECPEKIRGVITLGTTPKFKASKDWPGIADEALNDFHKQAHSDLGRLKKTFSALIAYPQRVSYQNPIPFDEESWSDDKFLSYLKILATTDMRDACLQLTVPCLHILGEKDSIVPVSIQQVLSRPKNSEVKVMKDAGHYLPSMASVSVEIKRFIEDVNAY